MGAWGARLSGLLPIAWRSLWRARRRTAISVSAIGFSLAIAVFFITFAGGVYHGMIENAVRLQAGHLTLEHPRYRDAPAVDLVVGEAPRLRERIARLPGVEQTKLLIQGQGVARSGNGSSGVALLGVEPAVELRTSRLPGQLVAGRYLAEGPAEERKVVIGQTLAERLKLKVGRKLVLVTNDVHGEVVEELLRVQGIFSTGAVELDGYLIQVPLAFAQRVYGLRPDQVTQLGVVLRNANDREEVDRALQGLLQALPAATTGPAPQAPGSRLQAPGSGLQPPGSGLQAPASVLQPPASSLRAPSSRLQAPASVLQAPGSSLQAPGSSLQAGVAPAEVEAERPVVVPWEQVLPDLAAYIRLDGGSNQVFIGIILFLSFFTMFNTILMSILERSREFAMLLALGTPIWRLRVQLLLEAALLGLLGCAVGLTLGGLASYAFEVYGFDLAWVYPEGVTISGFAVDSVVYARVTARQLLWLGGIVFFATVGINLLCQRRISALPVADLLR